MGFNSGFKGLRDHHHHQFILLLVEHRASMKSSQALRSPAISLTSFHDLPVFLISSSIVLRYVLFGLPLLLYPWGFQYNAVFSIAPDSLRNVCPIQVHFLLFIWISIGFCLVTLHSSSFVISSVHFIFIIRLKHWVAGLHLSTSPVGGYGKGSPGMVGTGEIKYPGWTKASTTAL